MRLTWILASLGLRTGIPLCVFSRQTPLFHFAQSEWVEDHLFVTSTSFALKGDECSGGLKRKSEHFLAFFSIFLHFVQMLTGQWVQAGRDKLNVTLSGKLSAGRAGLKKHETLCWGRWLVGRGGATWTECSSSSFLPKKKTKKLHFANLVFFNSIYCEMLTIPQVLFCQLKLQTEEESRSSSTFTAVSSLLTAGFLCIVTWSQFIGRVHVCYP